MVNSLGEAEIALKAADPRRRQQAVAYLAAHPGPTACAALLAALDDTDALVREAVIGALSQQNPADSLLPLTLRLHEAAAGRRNAAYSALIEIGGRRPEALVAALRASDAEPVRTAIANILGNLHTPVAVTGLIECLDHPGEAVTVQQAAAQALGRLGDRAATPALIRLATRGAPEARPAAIHALGQLDDEQAVEPLVQLLPAEGAGQTLIIEALGNIGRPEAVAAIAARLGAPPPDPELATVALEALIKIIIEPELGRRQEASSLAEARRQIPVAPLLEALRTLPPPGNAYAAHLLGCLTPPEALPHLVTALRHSDDSILRDATVEAILRYQAAAVPALVEALAHPEAPLRESAAYLLGMLADASLTPELLRHLSDPDLAVRQAVLHALGNVGGEAAYAGLLQAMEDPATQDTVLGIIGQTRDTGLIGHLQHYLYHGQPGTRRGAARALSLLGDETAVSLLLNATREPDDALRRAAADALALVRGNRAIDVLIEALGDRNWLVRQKAIEALSCIPDGRAVAAIMPLTHDPEWRVRHTLVQALGRVRDSRIYPALQDLGQDSDDWIRRETMDLGAVLDDERAVEILLHGLQDPNLSVRRAALAALGYRRDWSVAGAVAECLTDASPTLRQAAARTLAAIAAPMAVERIGLLVYDPVEEVRLEAVETLGELGQEDGLGALELLMQDEALAVRRRAARAVAHVGTPAAMEALINALLHPLAKGPAQAELYQLGAHAIRALLRAARASQPELRAAAALTLGQMPGLRTQIIPTLELLVVDPDQRVRDAAQDALKMLRTG